MVGEATQVQLACVSVFCSVAHIRVEQPSLFHAFLHGEVEHSLFLPVVDACDACVVAFTVISFYLLYHLGG